MTGAGLWWYGIWLHSIFATCIQSGINVRSFTGVTGTLAVRYSDQITNDKYLTLVQNTLCYYNGTVLLSICKNEQQRYIFKEKLKPCACNPYGNVIYDIIAQ